MSRRLGLSKDMDSMGVQRSERRLGRATGIENGSVHIAVSSERSFEAWST